MAEQNFDQFLMSLAGILATEGADESLRFNAGLFCKNLFVKLDEKEQEVVTQRWLALDPAMRMQIKNSCVSVLASPSKQARQGAAALVARLAVMEISAGQWLDIIKLLTDYVGAENSTPDLRVTTLETLGWICEDIVDFDADALIAHTDAILTAVVGCMQPSEPVPVVRAAIHALYNTLEFASKSFDVQVERDQLMQVIIGATNSADEVVRADAFICIVAVIELYYDKVTAYVDAIYQRSIATLQNAQEHETVRLQAIEVWATMADTESDILLKADMAAELHQPPPYQCFRIMQTVFPHLAPHLLNLLPVDSSTEMDDLAEGDDWTLAMSAATALKSISLCIGDDVVDYVMPFINANIASTDWRMREAAVMAFASIMEGTEEKILPTLGAAMGVLLRLMLSDAALMVRDTAAYAIGVVCDAHSNRIATPEMLPSVMQAVIEVLRKRDEAPSVAASACWAIDSIAYCIEREEAHSDATLEPYFNDLVTVLLETTQRPITTQSNLRMSSFEALNTMIKTAPAASADAVQQLVPFFCGRVAQLLHRAAAASGDERQSLLEEQGLCCATLHAITRMLKELVTVESANMMMEAYLAVFAAAGEGIIVQEETLHAVGVLANARMAGFTPYMQALAPHLYSALKNVSAHVVCNAAIGVVGDCCRAVGNAFEPCMKPVMSLLIDALNTEGVDQQVKLSALACFGDIAIACGRPFFELAPVVIDYLKLASGTVVNLSSPEEVEYLHELHEAIMEACVGIVNGFEEANNVNELPPGVDSFTQFMLAFAVHVHDTNPPLSAQNTLVGLIFDVAKVLGEFNPSVRQFIKSNAQLMGILSTARTSNDKTLRNTANLALQLLR